MKKQLAATAYAFLLCTSTVVEVPAANATIQIPKIVCSTVHPDTATASGPRIQHITVDGNPVSVLLPPQYGTSMRKYPVLYLLYGAESDVDSFLLRTNLIPVTSAFPDNQQFIVVTPSGGLTGSMSTGKMAATTTKRRSSTGSSQRSMRSFAHSLIKDTERWPASRWAALAPHITA
jgi:hypothetical protein